MSRAGDKAFERCDVKIVEFDDFIYEKPTAVTRGRVINPQGGLGTIKRIKVVKDTDTATSQYAGSGATLHCPRTEDDRVDISSAFSNHDGRLQALSSMRELAGELICNNCRFSNMDPVEVSDERARLARSEADRTQALVALEKARNELKELFPNTPAKA